MPTSFQIRFDWKAKNFFEDPLVIDLCEAVFDKDVAKMERLIAEGADVNTIGEDGMTPLYWAFQVDEDPRPFECLLKHKANPNVRAKLGRRKEIQFEMFPGGAVVHLVALGRYNRHFKTVFENGGDPNLPWEIPIMKASISAFHLVNPDAPDAAERLLLLIKKGAHVNARRNNGTTVVSGLVVDAHESGCRLALVALDAEADYRLYYKRKYHPQTKPQLYADCYFRLIHFLAEAEPSVNKRAEEDQTHYRAVVKWLEEHGESFEDAKADLERWDQWKKDGETGRIKAEHQKRLLEEARIKAAKKKD